MLPGQGRAGVDDDLAACRVTGQVAGVVGQERADVDRGAARIAVRGRQGQDAGAVLHEAALAAQWAGKGHVIAVGVDLGQLTGGDRSDGCRNVQGIPGGPLQDAAVEGDRAGPVGRALAVKLSVPLSSKVPLV